MVRRFRVRKKKTVDAWVICIQVLRAPNGEDFKNLGFRRHAPASDTAEELLQDDGDGDTLMRDLEVDMLETEDEDEHDNKFDEVFRIPPQWTPDRLLGNIIFEFTCLGQVLGWDAVVLRDRIMGPFWRRPMEACLTRLTDDWERTQPPHLRHLALIRDTRNTEEKRFLHYVYRTYHYFQQAVIAGEAAWEGVSRPVAKPNGKSQHKKRAHEARALDAWGFHNPNQKDFVRFNGTATLSDARSVVIKSRKVVARWDVALAEEIGLRQPQPPMLQSKVRKGRKQGSLASGTLEDASRDGVSQPGSEFDGDDDNDDNANQDGQMYAVSSAAKRKPLRKNGLNLTPEQRTSLGLKPSGRLTKEATKQILAHRRKTGDPASLPDAIVRRPTMPLKTPLMTKEERIALNLPPRGRLGLHKENEIREQRGLPKLEGKRSKKKQTSNNVAILTKQQRIALGLKDHGRLHQHFVDALRREQEDDIPLEQSPAVAAYREFLKNGAVKGTEDYFAPTSDLVNSAPRLPTTDETGLNTIMEVESTDAVSSTETGQKRKTSDDDVHHPGSKRQHVGSNASAANSESFPPPTQPYGQNNGSLNPDAVSNDLAIEVSLGVADVPASPEKIERVNLTGKPPREKSASSVRVQPTPGTEIDEIEDEEIPRVLPGIYVYLSAKRKIKRGRPRNACVTVFRLPSLRQVPWFKDEPESRNDGSQITSMGPCRFFPLQGDQNVSQEPANDNLDSSSTGMDTTPDAKHPPQPKAIRQLLASIEPDRDVIPNLAEDNVKDVDRTTQPESSMGEQNVASEKQTIDIEAQVQTGSSTHQTSEMAPEAEMVPETQEALANIIPTHDTPADATAKNLPPSCAAIGSSVGIGFTQVAKPTYRSPYSPSSPLVSATTPRQQSSFDNATPSTARLDDTVSTPESVMEMPQGVLSAIAEVEDSHRVALKKLSARSAGPAITGSALRFRREIIQEIIDRCGGVFPLHGEMWRPFSALWDQRHGHTSIPKPQSSTVSDTLKNMISDPSFKLKRMSFAVKARNATGSKERVIVTRLDMTPAHPRVMKLAYNMANNSMDKSHQYYPDEIRDLFEFESLYVPLAIAPKDASFTLDQVYPELLESSIKENRIRRRKEIAAQKKAEKEAAKKQNEQVEQGLSKRRPRGQSKHEPRAQRTRLASLNDKNKRYRRAAVQIPELQAVEEPSRQPELHGSSPAGTESSKDIPLISLPPARIRVNQSRKTSPDDTSIPDAVDDRHGSLDAPTGHALSFGIISLTDPSVRFHSATGTFATFSKLTERAQETYTYAASELMSKRISTKKRVRIDDSALRLPNKRPKNDKVPRRQPLDTEFIHSSSEDSDATSTEDEGEEARPKEKQKQKEKKRQRAYSKRQLGKNLPTPTLLERLTGLTGDPNDPIYTDPKQRRRLGRVRPWSENKEKQRKRSRKSHAYTGTDFLDHIDRFKKLCLTLVVASSLSTEDGSVNWSIVEQVYANDPLFDQHRTKELWNWVQVNMFEQVVELRHTFQSTFLAAYEAGRLPDIDDPESYDWVGLLRWAMRTCAYPELPLPFDLEEIRKLVADESNYRKLNRATWYREKIADNTRSQLQLLVPFVAPLHRSRVHGSPPNDTESRARSWIRANTATPQPLYDANQAHEKFKRIGEDVLTRVVGDLVQRDHLRMRKLKRQLPGRNYTFPNRLAKHYKRTFELEDFMTAATTKKMLDAIFSLDDSENRFYSISRSEEDGAIMAIMSLASEGKVKLVPQLPAVNNEFGASLPRLSKWGFCEGDYVHRAVDRERLFWDIHVVPTSKYEYGNPLQPATSPTRDWPSLPEPPLPGKHDNDAMLPIWSNIDGQSITWPWWYRILNLVLQPLFLQPGATTADVHSHCDERTTSIFEVQLVLDWLQSIGAVTRIIDGGYQVNASFWASFGDKLLDAEDDWFGEYVKRNTKLTSKQRWRDEYNLRFSTMQMRGAARGTAHHKGKEPAGAQANVDGETMSQGIVRDPRAQYGILQRALDESGENIKGIDAETQVDGVATNERTVQNTDGSLEGIVATAIPESGKIASTPLMPHTTGTPHADVEMRDADGGAEAEGANTGNLTIGREPQDPSTNAEGEAEDIDAEGDVDDMVY